jgi:chemotaxis protein CheD
MWLKDDGVKDAREQVKVGMAEMQVAHPPGELACFGIGSCVVIALFDPVAKVAGLAHAMLPHAAAPVAEEDLGKYADTAPQELVRRMEKFGVRRERLVARLVGGATMFSFGAKAADAGQSLGERNAENARQGLAALGISLQAEDTGGNYGRSIEFHATDGSLQVRTAARGTRWL